MYLAGLVGSLVWMFAGFTLSLAVVADHGRIQGRGQWRQR
jgi:hypothetical protein